ncbi:MAG TPA: NAD(P)-binding domain-containing protein [Polyangia bacterium]|nr:NAD(P)-binding domain-containing protein [Polyangia bacterium]
MQSLLVPAALFTLAALVMVVGSIRGRRRRVRAAARPGPKLKLYVHAINDDRCIGCDACVNVCPTDVLELVKNYARAVRFDDCIQCEMCQVVCPTRALVMYPEGTQPPPVVLPKLDPFYQTNIPGMYLIGEAAGKPLTKNASNLGRAVVEHMRQGGLEPGALGDQGVDVLMVGSGPGGLSAALTCIQHGLSYVVLEKENVPFSTIARYPKGKNVMAEPYDARCVGLIPVFDATKDEMVAAWSQVMAETNLRVELGELVEKIQRRRGCFEVVTGKRTLHAQRVVLATGTRGKPRRLGVPGENLPKVKNLLDDPDQHAGREVLVVGGGDSAAEAVIALAQAGVRVTLSYRGKQLARVNMKNREKVEKLVAARRVGVLWSSHVTEIRGRSVVLRLEGGQRHEIANDDVLLLIGADPPIEWLKAMGVAYTQQPHMLRQRRSDELIERLLGHVPETTMDNVLRLVFGRDGGTVAVHASQVLHAQAQPPRPRWRKVTPRSVPGGAAAGVPAGLSVAKRPPTPRPAEPQKWSQAATRAVDTRSLARAQRPDSWLNQRTRAVDPDHIVDEVLAASAAAGDREPPPVLIPGAVSRLHEDSQVLLASRLPTPLPHSRMRPIQATSDLAEAARQARARAHAKGEIRVPPQEQKTTLARPREARPQAAEQEREPLDEDSSTRVRGPLDAWGGVAKLDR